jgi:hypothetical protein
MKTITQKQLIEFAKQSELILPNGRWAFADADKLKTFASLIDIGANLGRIQIADLAAKAGMVTYTGGEMEAYNIGKASADDHSQAAWSFCSEDKLRTLINLIETQE